MSRSRQVESDRSEGAADEKALAAKARTGQGGKVDEAPVPAEVRDDEGLRPSMTGALDIPDVLDTVRRPQDLMGRCVGGRYVLESLLGSGATAWVFKARDLRKVEACAPQPFVAIKILNLDLQRRPEARFGLEREASRTQQLVHPNVVAVYDFDRDGGLFYLVMEWLSGPTLDVHLRQLTPTARRSSYTLAIIRGLITALLHAHAKGVIHGDLKPANIMLDDCGQPRVLDFGVARMVHAVNTDNDWSTGLKGYTPAYASYARLKGMNPSPQDDTYALACVLYELLTGRHPYDRRTALEVRQHKLKLARPKGLSRHQWRALAQALAVEDGPADGLQGLATAFVAEQRKSSPNRWIAVALASILALLWFERAFLVDQAMVLEQHWAPDLDRLEAHWQDLPAPRRYQLWLAVKQPVMGMLDGKIQEYRRRPDDEVFAQAWALANRMLAWKLPEAQLEASVLWLDQEQVRLNQERTTSSQPVREQGLWALTEGAASERADARLAPGLFDQIRTGRHEVARQGFGAWLQAQGRAEREKAVAAFWQDYARLSEDLPEPLARQAWREGQRFLAHLLSQVAAPETTVQSIDRLALKLIDTLDQGGHYEPLLAELQDTLAGLAPDHLQHRRVRERIYRLLQRQLAWYEGWGPLWQRYAHVARTLVPDAHWPDSPAADFLCRDLSVGDLRLANVCRDWLTPLVTGPELVLVADMERQHSFYLGRRETSVGEYNLYCRLSRECAETAAPEGLPITGVSVYQANRYARWLQRMTGQRYRLPTAQEWSLVALLGEASGVCPASREVRSSGMGEADRAGFLNVAGNVREWVTQGRQLRVRGGDVWNPAQLCSADLDERHNGKADSRTGFRLVREIE